MRSFTVAQIAAALDASAAGDLGLRVTGAAEPAQAGPDQLALAMSPRYATGLATGRARAAMLWPGADWQGLGLAAAIFAPRGRLAMAHLTRLMDPGPGGAPGLHPTVLLGEGAEAGDGASIGAYTVIGRDVRIGAGARIGPQVFIGDGARVGDHAVIHAGARIGPRVRIGDRVLIQPGAAVGFDGFSYVTARVSRAERARQTLSDAEGAEAQPWVRIHSLGSVEIGDDVEIGANSCVDAGTVRPTRIGSGTKLDNHVHVAHNCEVGRDCLFAGQVGLAGAVRIGDGVTLGGKVGVADNVFVGDGVVAGAGTIILSNVPAGRVMLGYPAVRMGTHVAMYKALRRLPRLLARLGRDNNAVPNSGESD